MDGTFVEFEGDGSIAERLAEFGDWPPSIASGLPPGFEFLVSWPFLVPYRPL
jgi:hypothetical protein